MKAIFKRTVLIAVSIFTASMLLFVGCNPTTSSSSNESKEEKEVDTRPAEEFILTSTEFAKQLTIGWNLGNTLDAHSNVTSNEWGQGLNSETCWGQPKTTQEMIEAVYAAGFKTIRIPIT